MFVATVLFNIIHTNINFRFTAAARTVTKCLRPLQHGIMDSNPIRGMDVHLLYLCVLSCR
jgi:hypothetical protein